MALIKRRKATYYDKFYNVNYYNVRNTAWEFLIKNNVTSYPLDLHNIISNNNWNLLTYKSYSKAYHLPREELKKISTDGFVDLDEEERYCIVINEENSKQRCRFTAAHEIGHIILHKVFKDEDRLEKEANMFAARILMPMILLKELDITTPEQLAEVCDVSIESASYRLKRYNQIKYRERFYTNPLEIEVFNNLKNFIKQKKN